MKLMKKSPLLKRSWVMGNVIGQDSPFILKPHHTALHQAVLGASGFGKSKYLELYIRNLLRCGHAGMLIDPHNLLAEDVMAFVAYAEKVGDPLWERVHFLEIGLDRAFAFDPFARLPLRGTVPQRIFFQCLAAVVDRTIRTTLRRYAEADQDIMNRLIRNLTNSYYGCGTALDDKNTHLGLGKALALCDPFHPEFPYLLDKVYDYLPDFVQADYQRLRTTKSEIVKDKWESAINQCRKFLSPIFSLQLAPGIRPPFNIAEVIAKGEFVIVKCGQTKGFSHDQKIVAAGFLIDDLLNAREAEEELALELRDPFHLILDESGEFLGEDLQRALKSTRKYGLSMTLAGQNLNSLVKGKLDLVAEVLDLCQTVVCFNNTFRPDKEMLQDRIGTGNLDWTKQLDRTQYHAGYMKIMTEDRSVSKSVGFGDSVADGRTESEGTQEGSSHGRTKTATKGGSEAERQGASEVKGADGSLKSISGGKDLVKANTSSDSAGESEQTSYSNSHSLAITQTKSRSRNVTDGETISYKTSLLARIETEWVWNGKYVAGTIPDQKEKMMQQIHCLQVAEAFVSRRGDRYAIPAKIAYVEDLWAEPTMKRKYTEMVKRKIAARCPYMFSPIDVCWAMERQAEPLAADEPVVIEPESEGEEPEINPLA